MKLIDCIEVGVSNANFEHLKERYLIDLFVNQGKAVVNNRCYIPGRKGVLSIGNLTCNIHVFDVEDHVDENLLSMLDAETSSALLDDTVTVLFDDSMECETQSAFFRLHAFFDYYNIDPSRVIYAVSALSVHNDYHDYCIENNIESRMQTQYVCHFDPFDQYISDDTVPEPTLHTNRPNPYLNLMRRPTSHRCAFAALLLDSSLPTDNCMSFGCSDKDFITERFMESGIVNNSPNRELADLLPLLLDNCPVILDKPDAEEVNYAHDPNNFKLYNESYVSLVSFTYYDAELKTVQANEKIFKPMAYMHPYIVQSTPNTLPYLKDYGYETFGKWFDESYDTIENDYDRAIAIINETERLSNITTKEWDLMIKDMMPVFKHNFYRLRDYGKSEQWAQYDLLLEKLT